MNLQTVTVTIAAVAGAAQTLPLPAVRVMRAYWLDANAAAGAPVTGTELTPVTGAPAAGQIQFTGTPSAPSTAVTLGAAATAGEMLLVEIVPEGGLPAAS